VIDEPWQHPYKPPLPTGRLLRRTRWYACKGTDLEDAVLKVPGQGFGD
jgi:hypothetical protein